MSHLQQSTLVDERQDLAKEALTKLGAKYKYGATGPRYDCSGLVNSVYSRHGYQLPRSSSAISSVAKSTNIGAAQPGDLIFFEKGGKVFHVSIIVDTAGDRLVVVHATTSRGVIQEDVLKSSYWRDKIYKVISLNDLPKK